MSEKDVRELHVPFKVYDECGHKHASEDEPGVVDIEYVGLTCEEGIQQVVCRHCNTTDGEVHEYTDNGEWPCATIKALDKP